MASGLELAYCTVFPATFDIDVGSSQICLAAYAVGHQPAWRGFARHDIGGDIRDLGWHPNLESRRVRDRKCSRRNNPCSDHLCNTGLESSKFFHIADA